MPLERLGRDGFRDDTVRALDALDRAGAGRARGFRAPVMSLTPRTPWAHEVLAELGLAYPSSVVPAGSALYAWPGHASACVRTAPGVWEIPVSVMGGAKACRSSPVSTSACCRSRATRSGDTVRGWRSGATRGCSESPSCSATPPRTRWSRIFRPRPCGLRCGSGGGSRRSASYRGAARDRPSARAAAIAAPPHLPPARSRRYHAQTRSPPVRRARLRRLVTFTEV